MAEVAKENSKKVAKNMTEAETDALKMISKSKSAAEAPEPTDTREGALKTTEGVLNMVEEAHKRLEIVLEELKLMDSEASAVN